MADTTSKPSWRSWLSRLLGRERKEPKSGAERPPDEPLLDEQGQKARSGTLPFTG